jgi:hypothetical protein
MQSKTLKPLTEAGHKFLDAVIEIHQAKACVEDAAYIARQLVQATLPHTDPKTNTWSRKNGRYTLSLQTGFDANGTPVGLPYGVIPRLLTFWIVSEAVRTKNPILQLGNNLSAFMREVGLDPNTGGGKRGDAYRLYEQMRRYFGAQVAFYEDLTNGQTAGETVEFMRVAKGYTLMWDVKTPHQGDLWGSSVKLDREFFETITSAPVPVDVRALRALKRSPLALDLYALCCYEAHRVSKSGRGRVIPWRSLMRQLGADYAGEHAARNFGVKARAALRKVEAVMPTLILDHNKSGLAVRSGSTPAIPYKKTN